MKQDRRTCIETLPWKYLGCPDPLCFEPHFGRQSLCVYTSGRTFAISLLEGWNNAFSSWSIMNSFANKEEGESLQRCIFAVNCLLMILWLMYTTRNRGASIMQFSMFSALLQWLPLLISSYFSCHPFLCSPFILPCLSAYWAVSLYAWYSSKSGQNCNFSSLVNLILQTWYYYYFLAIHIWFNRNQPLLFS